MIITIISIMMVTIVSDIWRWHLVAVFPLLLRTAISYFIPISLFFSFGSKRNNGHAWWHRIYAPATIYSRIKVKWQRCFTIEDLPSKIYVRFLSLCKQLRRKLWVQETTTATTMPKINDSTWWGVKKKQKKNTPINHRLWNFWHFLIHFFRN